MSLESDLHACIHSDNVFKFNSILAENEISTIMPIILDKLYSIALFGSIYVFNRVFTIPAVAQHLNENASARKHFLSTVLGHSSVDLVKRVFEIQLFRDEIISDPYAMTLSVATNRNCAPQALAMIQELTTIDEYIANNDNQIWLTAYVNYNYLAMNCLLEFPEVYAKVDAMDPKHSQGPDYINTRFMEYYFAKLSKSNLTEKETRLAYLILLTLIKTYPDRGEIRNNVKRIAESEEDSPRFNTFFYRTTKATRDWREKYLPDTKNIHSQRIRALLAIPAVRRMAQDNNVTWTVNAVAAEVPTRRMRVFF